MLHVWLAGLFMYALATDIAGRREAGLVAAIAWGLGGYLTGYPVLQLAVLESVVWLPLALLLIRRATRAARPVLWLVGAGLVLAVCALAGHPQTLMHAAYLCAAYYLYSTWHAGWAWRWILGGGAGLGLIALGVSAGAWLPAADYWPLSERAGAGYDFVRSGLPLVNYLQVLVPNALARFAPEYAGVGAALLAGLAICHRGNMPATLRRETAFWLAAALFAGVLALGDDGVLFAAGYRVLPGFSLFRQQERWLSLFSVAVALLAALGMTAWLGEEPEALLSTLKRVLWSLAALLMTAGLMLAVMLRGTDTPWLPIWGWAWVLAGLSGVLLLAPIRARWQRWGPVALGLLLLLLVVDLGAVNQRVTPFRSGYDIRRDAWDVMLATSGVEPESDAPARIDSSGLIPANLGELYGIEDIWGISPLRPRALEALRSLPRQRLYQLLDVGQVLSYAPLYEQGLELVAEIPVGTLWLQQGYLFLYRSSAPHARAWLVHDVLPVADQAAALAAVSDPALDPLATVVLEGEPTAAVVTPSSAKETVYAARVLASELVITVSADADGYLVVSEWYLDGLFGHGWRATVDGVAAPIRRADYALQAIPIPAGEHVVRLWYAAPALWAGVVLSIVSLAAVVLLARFGRWPVAYRRRVIAGSGAADRPIERSEGWPLPVGAARRAPYAAGALVVLGLILRLYRLGSQELRGDEALSYLIALGSPKEIVASLLAVGDPHSPLHYLLLHATIAVAGVSEFAMRLPSALLGVLAIPVVWGVGRATGGSRRGLLLATLAAMAQPLVWIGQDLRSQYVLAVLFYALATLILLRQARPAEIPERAGRWLWVAYAVCAALSVYAFYYAALALLGHGVYVLCHAERRRLFKPWLLSALLAAALFGPWPVAGRESLLSSGQLSDPDAPHLAPFVLESVAYLTAGETWSRPWVRGFAAIALLLAAAGARRLLRRDRALACWALTVVGTTLLALYLVRFVRATYEPRYLIVAALPWWLLLVAGLEGLLDGAGRWRRWLGLGMTLALLLMNVASVARYHTDPGYSRTAGYRQAAAIIAARALPGDVFVRNAPDPCWDYYLRDVPIPRAMVPSWGLLDTDAIAGELEALGETYERIWFAPAPNPAWDRDGEAGQWLEYNMLREGWARAQNHTVTAYRPLRTALDVLVPIQARLDNGVTLLGHTILVNGQPADGGTPVTLNAGDSLEVTVAWRAERALDRSYTAFVHLVSQDGVLLAQHDGIPLLGTRPTTIWESREVVLDRHVLTVTAPPAGDVATLHVGMYDSETVVRVPFAGGGDVHVITVPLAP